MAKKKATRKTSRKTTQGHESFKPGFKWSRSILVITFSVFAFGFFVGANAVVDLLYRPLTETLGVQTQAEPTPTPTVTPEVVVE